jgi:hypothetical protein
MNDADDEDDERDDEDTDDSTPHTHPDLTQDDETPVILRNTTGLEYFSAPVTPDPPPRSDGWP